MAISASATQKFVPIKEIRDGVAILKDGSMRSILLASSINFHLKSNDERVAILLQFQDFLNSLDFSIQIFIESRRLDIRPYIALLEDRHKEQQNDLMKLQVRQYINFVKNFTESTSIMTKSFFVVVPYASSIITSSKFSILGGKKEEKNEESTFEESKTQLEQRVSVVEQGLSRSGIRVIRLGTEEVVELFYKIFNPGETEKPIKLQ